MAPSFTVVCIVTSGAAQPPVTHVMPSPHAVPQPPQLAASVCVSVHALPHIVIGASHAGMLSVQLPALHVCVSVQVTPHPPQFIGSVWKLVHTWSPQESRWQTFSSPHAARSVANKALLSVDFATTIADDIMERR